MQDNFETSRLRHLDPVRAGVINASALRLIVSLRSTKRFIVLSRLSAADRVELDGHDGACGVAVVSCPASGSRVSALIFASVKMPYKVRGFLGGLSNQGAHGVRFGIVRP